MINAESSHPTWRTDRADDRSRTSGSPRPLRCGPARARHGGRNLSVVVVDTGELDDDDRVRDMIDLMTGLSARLYGRRSARNRAQRALDSLKP